MILVDLIETIKRNGQHIYAVLESNMTILASPMALVGLF